MPKSAARALPDAHRVVVAGLTPGGVSPPVVQSVLFHFDANEGWPRAVLEIIRVLGTASQRWMTNVLTSANMCLIQVPGKS